MIRKNAPHDCSRDAPSIALLKRGLRCATISHRYQTASSSPAEKTRRRLALESFQLSGLSISAYARATGICSP